MSNRLEKVNSLLQQEISQIILKEVDVSLLGIVSVVRVEVAADLKTAQVWVSFLENNNEETFKRFKKFIPQIQYFLAKRITLKFTPRLRFGLEIYQEYADHIETLFKEIKDEKHLPSRNR